MKYRSTQHSTFTVASSSYKVTVAHLLMKRIKYYQVHSFSHPSTGLVFYSIPFSSPSPPPPIDLSSPVSLVHSLHPSPHETSEMKRKADETSSTSPPVSPLILHSCNYCLLHTNIHQWLTHCFELFFTFFLPFFCPQLYSHTRSNWFLLVFLARFLFILLLLAQLFITLPHYQPLMDQLMQLSMFCFFFFLILF